MSTNNRDAFAMFDRDSDGVISADELEVMMAYLGNKVTPAEVGDIIAEAGSRKANSITVAQFNKLMDIHKNPAMRERIGSSNIEDDIRLAFRLFDRDGDGIISVKEMKKALKHFGISLTERETELVIAEATMTSGEGEVDYEIFKKVMMSS